MPLAVFIPPYCFTEVHWVFSILFGEHLEIEYFLFESATNEFIIKFQGRSLVLPCTFFSVASANWLGQPTLPILPLASFNVSATALSVPLVEQPLPVLFGKPEIEITDNTIRFGVDIIGTIFFMLSRYEEAVLPDRDIHDRFPARASLAHRAGFLDRPIVDEYVELLWTAMKSLWPTLERKAHHPKTLVSCDVDNPYDYGFNTVFAFARRFGGDVFKRRSISTARQTLISARRRAKQDYSTDAYLKSIDWIMEVNERAGNRVAFYFIPAHSHSTLDGCYSLDEPVIRDLLRRIHARGHEIGLHGSYNSYQDAAQTRLEADKLRQVMMDEGIQQVQIGGRQHFLRWKTPYTACNCDAAELNYDSTLSFADQPGFRCGTCHEYPMYDLIKRRSLNLRQRPLIVMESSVIDDRYLGMGHSQDAFNLMNKLKQTCHAFQGSFSLLWHNCHLVSESDRSFYQKLI